MRDEIQQQNNVNGADKVAFVKFSGQNYCKKVLKIFDDYAPFLPYCHGNFQVFLAIFF